MAGKQTAEAFLNLVKQSGLVSVDQLKKLLSEYQEKGVKLGEPAEIADEADWAVPADTLAGQQVAAGQA